MEQKVVVITGASSGMGKETAIQLIQEGYTVYGMARSVDKMKVLKSSGGHIIQMDITSEDQIQSAVNQIITEQGNIDVLINNAGYAVYGAIEDVTIEYARRQFEVNLFGLARLTQLVLPYMRKQGFGRIINITSVGGKVYTPLGAWYHAAKFALEGWSDCLRLETKQHGIDVVIVEPGMIKTEGLGIAVDPLLERSGNGAYANIAKAMAESIKAISDKGRGSPPSVIADAISKILRTEKPKSRYAVGKLAKPLMFIRKHVSDRVFDKMMMSRVK